MSTPPHAATTPVDAEQLIGRILKLIDGVHGIADLAPDNIERLTGLQIVFHSDDRNEYGASGPVAPDWVYSLSSVAYRQGQKPNRLDFDFIDTRKIRSEAADTAPICSLDFEGYDRALTDIGFKQIAVPAKKEAAGFGYQGVEPRRFVRGDVEVTVRTYGDRDPDLGRACVSGLRISVLG